MNLDRAAREAVTDKVEAIAMMLATHEWQFYHPAAQDRYRAKARAIIHALKEGK